MPYDVTTEDALQYEVATSGGFLASGAGAAVRCDVVASAGTSASDVKKCSEPL